jgi:xylose isomerase
MSLAMYEILRGGGFTTGGFNLDTKLRRQSLDRDDLFWGHIGGIDTLARSLLVAVDMLGAGTLEDARDARYGGWETDRGREILAGEVDLATLADRAVAEGLDPQPVSGRQEWLEHAVNQHIWSVD